MKADTCRCFQRLFLRNIGFGLTMPKSRMSALACCGPFSMIPQIAHFQHHLGMAEIHVMNRSIHSRMAQQQYHSARRAYSAASERDCIIHFTLSPPHAPGPSHALDSSPRALQLFDDSSLRPCDQILQHAE